jgi:hypothetical protein
MPSAATLELSTQRTGEGSLGTLSKKAASMRAWREANPEKVAAYNASRREEYRRDTAAYRDKTCLRCGVEFTAAHANVLRCPPCRKAVARERDAAKKRRRRSSVREVVAWATSTTFGRAPSGRLGRTTDRASHAFPGGRRRS